MAAHSDSRVRRESRRYIFILLVNLLPDNPLAFFPPRQLARDFCVISKLALHGCLELKIPLGFCAFFPAANENSYFFCFGN